MSNSLKFVAIIMTLVVLCAIYSYAAAESVVVERTDYPVYRLPVEPKAGPYKIVAIMPDTEIELVVDDESDADGNNQNGQKNFTNAKYSAKREYHRRMMFR